MKRPGVIGKYTNTYVYERLPDRVLEKLRAVNPTENGRRKFRHHQWLTRDIGYRELVLHINGLILLMQAATSWTSFERLFHRAFPKPDEGVQIEMFDSED